MDLTIEELHKFDDMSTRQRQHNQVKSKEDNKSVDDERLLFGQDGFTFEDFLDTINPLQHIPLVSTIYRELTGDKISLMPNIIGGALFGGPIGAGAAIFNTAVNKETGKDIGQHVLSMFNEDPPLSLVENSVKLKKETPVSKKPIELSWVENPPIAIVEKL